MSAVSESVSWSGHETSSLRKVQLEYDDFYIRCNAVSTNLWFITIPNTKHINYEDDQNLINFIRPIFEETEEILIGNRLKEMQFDDVEDDYIFIGVISCENKSRSTANAEPAGTEFLSPEAITMEFKLRSSSLRINGAE